MLIIISAIHLSISSTELLLQLLTFEIINVSFSLHVFSLSGPPGNPWKALPPRGLRGGCVDSIPDCWSPCADEEWNAKTRLQDARDGDVSKILFPIKNVSHSHCCIDC